MHHIPESLHSSTEKYEYIYSFMSHSLKNEKNLIANLAHLSSIIMEQFQHHWVGFYLVEGRELVVGPYQGPVACSRIKFGNGVCGKSWEEGKTIIVDDVHKFEGHIACSSFSNSEIVVPLFLNQEIVGVLDIDSVNFGQFEEEDKFHLEKTLRLFNDLLSL